MIRHKDHTTSLGRAVLAAGLGSLLCLQSATVFAGVRNDQATTQKGSKVTVNVIKNDDGFNRKNFKIAIVGKPKRGNAKVSSKNIIYTPKSGFVGTDKIVYRLTDNRGFKRKATVTIRVKASSSNNSSKRAVDDKVTTKKGKKITVDVARNDAGYNKNNYRVAIVGKPKKGKAKIQGGRKIVYTPNGQFVGTDTIEYRLTDNRGFNKRAKVRITVSKNGGSGDRTSDSAGGNRIILQWDKNKQKVDGYLILFGIKRNQTFVQVADLSARTGKLDRNAPSVVLFPEADLGLKRGDNACFSVQAYNNKGYSRVSETVCGKI